jgi:ABC-2 type transport system permease protein
MTEHVTLASTTRSEWIKFRSVRSTRMGILVTFVLTLGIGALITTAIRGHWSTANAIRKLTFDAVSTSLGGTLFAQFAVGVIGTLFITSEYSSGAIRTTLAAVPNRILLTLGKLIVLVISMLVVSEAVCVTTFLMGQAIYSGVVPTASLSSGAVLRAVLLAGVYLTLLSVLGFALGLILRQSAACISVFTSLLLIVPIIIFFLPQSWQDSITKYEPSALGRAMMSTTPPDQTFSAWTGFGLLVLYVAVVLGIGVALLARRDA